MKKYCKICGKTLTLTQAELKEGRKNVRQNRSFCSHKCSQLFRDKDKHRLVQCLNCDTNFYAPNSNPNRKYCSNDCYLQIHRTKPKTCLTCKKSFVSYSRNQKYCSRTCMPCSGKNNPNYGNRKKGMFSHTAEFRKRLALSRMGSGNPNYNNGSTPYRYRYQTAVYKWGLKNYSKCFLCESKKITIHHIIPRRHFLEVAMSNFSQNFVPLCRKHHKQIEHKTFVCLKEKNIRKIPFLNHLPESIVHQLEMDGSVCKLPRECDFSPIGNVAELEILPEFYL